MGQIREYGLSLPPSKAAERERQKKKLYENDIHFNEIINIARLKYIGTDLGFSTYDLKTEFKLTEQKAKYLYSLLRLAGGKSNLGEYISSITPDMHIDKCESKIIKINNSIRKYSVVDDINFEKLRYLRELYSSEIKIHGEQSKFTMGFIYLITNPVFPNWVKGGMTVDYEHRLHNYNLYDPCSGYKLEKVCFVENRRKEEINLLRELALTANGNKGEWFKIGITDAIVAFDNVILESNRVRIDINQK